MESQKPEHSSEVASEVQGAPGTTDDLQGSELDAVSGAGVFGGLESSTQMSMIQLQNLASRQQQVLQTMMDIVSSKGDSAKKTIGNAS